MVTGDPDFTSIFGTAKYVKPGTGSTQGLMAVTLGGLNPTQTYSVQVFVVDTRAIGKTTQFGSVLDSTGQAVDTTSGNGSSSFQYDYSKTGNSIIGAYTTGTFTADAASQTFYVENFNSTGGAVGGQINALVLQPGAAVPEPTSLTLLGMGGMLMGWRRRKN